MAQIFNIEEKIGNLTNNGTSVTLLPSVLSIGGKQYRTTTLNVNYPSLTANTLYMIYAIVNSGSPAIVISTNFNSIGPVGYNSWKLVGAFYSNGESSVGFGAFVNIVGKPSTECIDSGILEITSTGTPPTKGTIEFDKTRYRIDGKHIYIQHAFRQTTTGANGTKDYLFAVPKSIDLSKYVAYSTVEGRGPYILKSNLGKIQIANLGTSSLMDGVVNVYDLNNVRYAGMYNRAIDANSQGYIGQGSPNWFALGDLSDVSFLADFFYQSSELSETPIIDL